MGDALDDDQLGGAAAGAAAAGGPGTAGSRLRALRRRLRASEVDPKLYEIRVV